MLLKQKANTRLLIINGSVKKEKKNDNNLGKLKRRPIKLSKVFFSKKKIVQSKVLVVVHYKSTLSSLRWNKK